MRILPSNFFQEIRLSTEKHKHSNVQKAHVTAKSVNLILFAETVAATFLPVLRPA